MIKSAAIRNIALSLMMTGGVLLAQTPSKVGVINLQQAIVQTQEGQAALAKLQRDHVEPRTKELEARQKDITDLRDKLTRGAATMSATAQQDLQSSIDAKTKQFNRAVEDYEFDTQEEQRKVLQDLSAKMQTVVADYVAANNFSLILDTASQGLVWRHDSVDITAAIIDAYNKKYPAAAGAVPAPAGAAPAPTTSTAPPAAPQNPPAAPVK